MFSGLEARLLLPLMLRYVNKNGERWFLFRKGHQAGVHERKGEEENQVMDAFQCVD